jgi:hypothetical protein
MQNENKNFLPFAAGIIVMTLLVLGGCFILLARWLGGANRSQATFPADATATDPTSVTSTTGTPIFSTVDTPTPPVELTRGSVENISAGTLKTLLDTLVPENDPYTLACGLQNICNVPKTLPAPAAPLKIGLKKNFWIVNTDTNNNVQVTATLMYITPHSYFWAGEGTNVNNSDMKKLMDTFENKIYPTDREFFGSEWTPGVDGDPHIYVVYANGIGNNVGGYFNSSDEFNPLVHKYSNGHESYVLGGNQDLAAPFTYHALAHEFVHMIQFSSDRNDVSWLNEGFAEVGVFINGYYANGWDAVYAQNPDLQLNTWVEVTSPDFGPHYGMSFLYLAYFLDRFGKQASQALTKNPENDLASVDSTLKSLGITDKNSGNAITADDVFIDWAVANFLQDGSVGDGRYVYHNYPNAPKTSASQEISSCPTQAKKYYIVHQYGVDLIHFRCSGKYTLRFEGATETGLLPVDAYSGKYAFWSNEGNESDMTLTREFDFRAASGPLTLKYRTWYDLEKYCDFAYLEVSSDAGKTWKIIKTPAGTDRNPSGSSYGWGYTGKTDGWIQESVDLSQFKGQKVLIRFEYVTDPSFFGAGLLLDDISVPEINYATDFEADNGGWEAAGFARVGNLLPQTFRLALIDQNGITSVQNITLGPDQTTEITTDLTNATLVVTGTTRFTSAAAVYSITVR